jgi:hypothetical protein
MKNIDDLSVELTKLIGQEHLYKALPPKLLYRLRAWKKKLKPSPVSDVKKFEKIIKNIVEQHMSMKSLKKNEMMASFMDNGTIKMEFGAEVPEKVKKAAVQWAKKRGLNAVEASLNKSAASPSYILYAPSKQNPGIGLCTRRSKWQF